MLSMTRLDWDAAGSAGILAPGTALGSPELLFDKIEDEQIAAQTDRLARIKKENTLKAWHPEPVAEPVDFDTFCRGDLRVGTVTACVKVPKADKLLQLTIDDGTSEPRTIVSGIAAWYAPEDLVGRQVCFIANLPPRKLRGIESQGMVLSAIDRDGRCVVMGPTAPVAPGVRVQ